MGQDYAVFVKFFVHHRGRGDGLLDNALGVWAVLHFGAAKNEEILLARMTMNIHKKFNFAAFKCFLYHFFDTVNLRGEFC